MYVIHEIECFECEIIKTYFTYILLKCETLRKKINSHKNVNKFQNSFIHL